MTSPTLYPGVGIRIEKPREIALNIKGARGDIGLDIVTPADERDGKYLQFVAGGSGRRAVAVTGLGGADATLRTDLQLPTGAALVNYRHSGTGAVSRGLDEVLDRWVDIRDFGGQPTLDFDAPIDCTPAFDKAKSYLATIGGGEIYFPALPPGQGWFINGVINQLNIAIVGGGGVGETSSPYVVDGDPGVQTSALYAFDLDFATMQVGVGGAPRDGYETTAVRKCGARNIVLNGSNGKGDQSPAALRLAGGTMNFVTHNLDVMDGMDTVWIEGGDGQPATGIFFQGMTTNRNDVIDAASSNFKIVRHPDDVGYTTGVYINSLHSNSSGLGNVFTLDGTTSPGLLVHIGDAYTDFDGPAGMLAADFVSGRETIRCNFWNPDPKGAGQIIFKRPDMIADPTRFLQGYVDGSGGQLIELSDGSTVPFGDEPSLIANEALLRRTRNIGPVYWNDPDMPYRSTGLFQNTATQDGPLLIYQGDDGLGVGDGLETLHQCRLTRGMAEEEVTLSTTDLITYTDAYVLPPDSYIEAVCAIVTEDIEDATAWSLGSPAYDTRFTDASTDLVALTKVVGLNHLDHTGPEGPRQTIAQRVGIKTTGIPSAGKVRVSVFYRTYRAPQN